MEISWVKFCKLSDFEAHTIVTRRILARPVGVIKDSDGTLRAMEMSCKHENADLSQGRIIGDIVTCPWHGWKYDLKTGGCIWGGTARLRPHALKIEGDQIFVSLRPIDSEQHHEDGQPEFDNEMYEEWQ